MIPDPRVDRGESQKLSVISRLREVATKALWETPCPILSGVDILLRQLSSPEGAHLISPSSCGP